MSLASIVGGRIAFPINYWLVKNHLKHGCMTMHSLSLSATLAWVAGTFLLLLGAIWLTAHRVPIRFS